MPLGYFADADKTARTFPVIDGVRYSVPGDRARLLADGEIELLGRDSVTINSGGEKIFAEEVERAIAGHPSVHDVVVVGRASERWGQEVVALVELSDGAEATADGIVGPRRPARRPLQAAEGRAVPRAIQRSPSGKADYRWAKAQVQDTAPEPRPASGAARVAPTSSRTRRGPGASPGPRTSSVGAAAAGRRLRPRRRPCGAWRPPR